MKAIQVRTLRGPEVLEVREVREILQTKKCSTRASSGEACLLIELRRQIAAVLNLSHDVVNGHAVKPRVTITGVVAISAPVQAKKAS